MGNICNGKPKSKRNSKRESKLPKKLTEKELEILLGSTNYNKAEIEEWHRGFIKDNPRARLDKKEFINTYKIFYPHGKPDTFCEHVFRVFDTDGNGYIDFQEFLIAISITSTNHNMRKKLEWIFELYDIDGNGQIDRDEFRTIVLSIYQILDTQKKSSSSDREKHIDDLFSKIDTDKSKYITLDEFIDACSRDHQLLELLAPSA